MKKALIGATLFAATAVSACQLTETEAMIVGGIAGGTAGLIAANVVDANPEWRAVAVAGGAVAGTLIARNTVTGQCAYSKGPDSDEYEVRACPT